MQKTQTHPIMRFTSDLPASHCEDLLALEEPLEIRLGLYDDVGVKEFRSLSITMRTPGDDLALACGFLFSEGMINSFDEIEAMQACGPRQAHGYQNIVKLDLRRGHPFRIEQLQRHFYTTSSCGICGKSSLQALEVEGMTAIRPPSLLSERLSRRLLLELPDRLQKQQQTFQKTGGLHASGLFNSRGALVSWGEDVGRHNALDKVVGRALQNGHIPLHDHILLLSGRASFELMQKAIKASIPVVAAIGAPSSLAVELAQKFNVLLIGFLRDQRFNVYHDNGYLSWGE